MNYTAEEVRVMRDETGLSFSKCQEILTRIRLTKDVKEAKTVDDLRHVILTLIREAFPLHPTDMKYLT